MTNRASSDARNRTTALTSSGVPILPSGDISFIISTASSLPGASCSMPVSIGPGCTEFTRMPMGPNSLAATRVIPCAANFDAV